MTSDPDMNSNIDSGERIFHSGEHSVEQRSLPRQKGLCGVYCDAKNPSKSKGGPVDQWKECHKTMASQENVLEFLGIHSKSYSVLLGPHSCEAMMSAAASPRNSQQVLGGPRRS